VNVTPTVNGSVNARRSGRRRRTGGSVLEMVLVLPVLLSLAFGTVEFGYYFYVKSNVQAAAREGARAAILPSAAASDVTTAVSNAMTAAGLNNSGYTTTVTDANGAAVNVATAPAGTAIKVQVQCSWGTVGLRPLGLIGTGKQVVGATTMRKES
jgi:Flp pilus assembly protein TadG